MKMKLIYEKIVFFIFIFFFLFIIFKISVFLQGPPPQGPIKFTIAETLERIKEEFNFLQAQYHS